MTATPRLFDDLLKGGAHLLENIGTVEHDPSFDKLAFFKLVHVNAGERIGLPVAGTPPNSA